MTKMDLLPFAERQRKLAFDAANITKRSKLGQFFTPKRAAVLIASMLSLPTEGTEFGHRKKLTF